VEASNIKHKAKRRNWRALRGTKGDQEENLRGALEDESALAFREERLNPCHRMGGDPLLGDNASMLVGTVIVKTTFDIQEES